MTTAERVRLFRPQAKLPRLDSIESTFLSAARKASNWQMELLRLQLADGTQPNDLILGTKPIANLRDALILLLVDSYNHGAVTANEEVRLATAIHNGLRFTAESFAPEVGINWYRQYALRIVGEEQAAVLDRAKTVIADGIERGVTHREAVQELGEVFTGFGRNRLDNIVRTETAKIYEQARWREFDSNEEIVGYEIMGIHDARICEICAYRDGKRIPKGAIGGWLPPVHSRCRCVCTPVFGWEEDVEYTDPSAGPKPQAGFGTTSMKILDWRTKAGAQIGRRVR